MKAALKKEFMYFSRTFRMFGVIFSILIFSIADPLILKGAQMMFNWARDMAAEETEFTQGLSEADMDIMGMFDDFDAATSAASSTGDLTSTALLIVLLVLMQPSGGEQKKRSVIIPRCAGLTPVNYAAPKFIIYPLTAFASGVLSMLICSGFSLLLFGGELNIGNVILGACAIGLYLAFAVTAQLMAGICTGRPGLSVIIVILSTNVLPVALNIFRVNRFNPFALPSVASSAITGTGDMLDIWVSIGVTAVLGVIFYFVTLFTLTINRIDNSGNEAVL